MACPPVSATSLSVGWFNVMEAIPSGPHAGECCAGDGSTDDSTALQGWIDYATGAGMPSNPVIYLPPGIYEIGTGLTISKPCTILGLAEPKGGVTTIRVNSFAFDAIHVTGVTGITFYGFRIGADGDLTPPTGTTGHAIRLTNCSDATIEEMDILNHWNGAIIDSCSDVLLQRVGCVAFNYPSGTPGARYGFKVLGAGTNTRFVFCGTNDPANNFTMDAFVVEGGSVGVHLLNCGTSGCYRGFYTTSSAGASPDEMTLVIFSTAALYALYLDAGGSVTLSGAFITDPSGSASALGAVVTTPNFAGQLAMLGNFIGAIAQGVQINGGSDLSISGGLIGSSHDALLLDSSCPVSISGVQFNAANDSACIHLGASQNVRVNVVGAVFRGGGFGVQVDAGCTAAVNVNGCIYNGIGNSDAGSSSLRQYNDNTGPTGGPNPAGLLSAPTLVNNSVYTNSTGYDIYAYISGGTVTAVAINGSVTGAIQGGVFRVATSETIKVTFTGPTSWVWWGE